MPLLHRVRRRPAVTTPFPGQPQQPRGRRLPPIDRRVIIVVAIAGALVALNIRNGRIGRGELLFFAVLIPSIILHEVSHGAVAFLFGDDTAKRAGRLSLNPLRHVDPIGTVILPAIMIFAGGPAFGYAKPVPVNPRKMRRPRDHGLLTSLAGPATNIVLSLLAIVGIKVLGVRLTFFDRPNAAEEALLLFGLANVFLAVFNLLPLPPLDGSAVIERVMPNSWWPTWLRLREYSMLLLFALVFLVPGFISFFFDPAERLWLGLAF